MDKNNNRMVAYRTKKKKKGKQLKIDKFKKIPELQKEDPKKLGEAYAQKGLVQFKLVNICKYLFMY